MTNAPINLFVAAKTVGHYANWRLTRYELNTRLYYLQMLHLGRYNRPLIATDFVAAELGPQVKSLEKKLRVYQDLNVPDIFPRHELNSNPEQNKFIKEALTALEKFKNHELVGLLILRDGAFAATLKNPNPASAIDENLMKNEYEMYYKACVTNPLTEVLRENLTQIKTIPGQFVSEFYDNKVSADKRKYGQDSLIHVTMLALLLSLVMDNSYFREIYAGLAAAQTISYTNLLLTTMLLLMLAGAIVPVKRGIYQGINNLKKLLPKKSA